jgi:copper(I)-binding protein
MYTRFFAAASLLLFAWPALAAPVVPISNPYIPTPPGSTGVAYMRVLSDSDDAITGAHSDCCTAVEIHSHEMNGPIMQMRRVASVPLKAGEATNFAPHGLHVMLVDLKKPLQPGDHVAITFTFAHAAEQTVIFPVAAAPLQEPMQSPMRM